MVMGLSPKGESLPPSRLKPSPVPSFFRLTVIGAPRGTSTNFRSKNRTILLKGVSHEKFSGFFLHAGIDTGTSLGNAVQIFQMLLKLK
jgi:hypothetical protein